MIKALQTLLVKGCIALLIAAYAVCVVGGAAADQPEWIRSGWKIAQNRGRPGATGEPEPDKIQFLRQRAETGDAIMQCALGIAYLDGKGVPQNYEEAAKWLGRAAKQEDANAQCLLGVMHYRGNGIRQNHAEAINLFRGAAMRGHIYAQFTLGVMHALGHGVPQNYREAYIWYSIAATSGFDSTAPALDSNLENINAGTQRDLLADRLPPADLSAAQAEATRLHAEIRKNLEQIIATQSGATD